MVASKPVRAAVSVTLAFSVVLGPFVAVKPAAAGKWYDAETGHYYCRARYYPPELARWTSPDPNGTGVILLPGLSYHAANPVVTVSMDYELQFADGTNFYEFLRSSPPNRHDPSGLLSSGFDYFGEAELLSDDLTAHKIYVLSEINEKARWASLGLETASEIALSLIPGYSIYEAYKAVGIIRSGRGGLMDYPTVGLAGVSNVTAAIKAAKYLNKARLWATRGSHARRFVGSYRTFTRHNFRHNLKVRTGVDPGRRVHAHHVLPKEHADQFTARGIDVHDPKYGAWWAEHDHLSAHRQGYNNRWTEFFERNRNAGIAEIEEFGRRLAREYGFEIGF